MENPTRILTVDLDGDDGLIVTFSDETTAAYLVDELLELRPHRESIGLYPTNVRWTKAAPQIP
jgi:hypothetical protein